MSRDAEAATMDWEEEVGFIASKARDPGRWSRETFLDYCSMQARRARGAGRDDAAASIEEIVKNVPESQGPGQSTT
jgi:hypothetical protein